MHQAIVLLTRAFQGTKVKPFVLSSLMAVFCISIQNSLSLFATSQIHYIFVNCPINKNPHSGTLTHNYALIYVVMFFYLFFYTGTLD